MGLGRCVGSAEHHGFVAVAQNAMLHLPAHGAREHDALHILADGGEVGRTHGVVDAFDVLLDDGAFVEIGGDVMRRGANELDPARIGLRVGARALEAGQERVVDVDGSAFELGAELSAQNLHIAREHQQRRAALLHHAEEGLFLRPLGFGGFSGLQRKMVKLDAVAARQIGESGVIGDDGGDVHRQLPGLPAVEQIVEAMAVLTDGDDDLGANAQIVKLSLHVEALAHIAEQQRELGSVL